MFASGVRGHNASGEKTVVEIRWKWRRDHWAEIAFKEFLKGFLVRPLDWLVDALDNCEVELSQAW